MSNRKTYAVAGLFVAAVIVLGGMAGCDEETRNRLAEPPSPTATPPPMLTMQTPWVNRLTGVRQDGIGISRDAVQSVFEQKGYFCDAPIRYTNKLHVQCFANDRTGDIVLRGPATNLASARLSVKMPATDEVVRYKNKALLDSFVAEVVPDWNAAGWMDESATKVRQSGKMETTFRGLTITMRWREAIERQELEVKW